VPKITRILESKTIEKRVESANTTLSIPSNVLEKTLSISRAFSPFKASQVVPKRSRSLGTFKPQKTLTGRKEVKKLAEGFLKNTVDSYQTHIEAEWNYRLQSIVNLEVSNAQDSLHKFTNKLTSRVNREIIPGLESALCEVLEKDIPVSKQPSFTQELNELTYQTKQRAHKLAKQELSNRLEETKCKSSSNLYHQFSSLKSQLQSELHNTIKNCLSQFPEEASSLSENSTKQIHFPMAHEELTTPPRVPTTSFLKKFLRHS